MSLSPFFSYFGAKWQLAPRYPKPRFDTIVEPFAGSAGYATRYHSRRVILIEKDPVVAGIWRWLIGASARDILALPEDPTKAKGDAAALLAFHVNQGARHTAHSRQRRSGGFHGEHCGTWCRAVRARLASQVDKIRHWRVIEGDYSEAPDVEATWFVDPPYVDMASSYPQGRDAIDFAELGAWCQSRRGQVIACENEGATWLPFQPFARWRTSNLDGVSREVIWTNDGEAAA